VRPRSKFTYLYDYGDSWRHAIVVEKTLDEVGTPLPTCIDGARSGPPEDSGGSWGYANMLKALADPGADDRNSAQLREWLGEDFDPEAFDLDAINGDLQSAFPPTKTRAKRKKQRK
jgi:hypothetical protein